MPQPTSESDERIDPSAPDHVAEWLAAARTGDREARDRLFGACRSFVATVARCHLNRRLQAKVDASDVVQQSLLEAHRGFDGFAGETPQEWLAWLKRIIRHNACDAAKRFTGVAKRDARREVPLATHDSESRAWHAHPIDPASSPSGHAIRWEEEIRLATAIEALPEEHREVLVLRNIERLPFEEVGRRMGRSSGACRMLWMRAIESLKHVLVAAAARGGDSA